MSLSEVMHTKLQIYLTFGLFLSYAQSRIILSIESNEKRKVKQIRIVSWRLSMDKKYNTFTLLCYLLVPGSLA
jgi:hypothetical protein